LRKTSSLSPYGTRSSPFRNLGLAPGVSEFVVAYGSSTCVNTRSPAPELEVYNIATLISFRLILRLTPRRDLRG